jgi:hypothetical protein
MREMIVTYANLGDNNFLINGENLETLIVINCPTTLNAFDKIIQPKFIKFINENSAKCLQIHLKIDEILNPISVEQIQLMSLKFNSDENLLISFESKISKQRSIYWRIRHQKYFCTLICDNPGCSKDEIGALGLFVCNFLIQSMKNDNHVGELIILTEKNILNLNLTTERSILNA